MTMKYDRKLLLPTIPLGAETWSKIWGPCKGIIKKIKHSVITGPNGLIAHHTCSAVSMFPLTWYSWHILIPIVIFQILTLQKN